MIRPRVGHVFAALPPLALLAVDPGANAPFGPIKWLVVPTLVLGGAGALLFRRPVFAGGAVGRVWLAFLVVVVLAALTGLDPVIAWVGTAERHFGVMAWVVAALAFAVGRSLDQDERRVVAASCAVTGAVLGVWAGAEALGWRPFDLVGAGDRPVATLGSSAYLGAAAALLAPIAAGRSRWLGIAAGAALVLSGSRAGWLGVALAGVLLVVRRRPPLRLVAATLAAAVALALAGGVAHRLPDLVTDQRGGAAGRVDEWRVAVRVVADHPLLGVGPEGYRIAFGSAVDEAYEREHGRVPLPDRAHSSVLDVAATTGVAGAGLYVALLTCVAVAAWRELATDRWPLAVGLIAYGTQGLLLFPLAEVDPVFWLLAGIVVGPGFARVVPRAAAVVCGALALAAVVAGSLDVAADRRGDPHLRPDGMRYHLAASRELASTGSSIGLDRAIAQLDRALEISPRDPVVRLERARLLVARARRSGVERHARTAERAVRELLHDDPHNTAAIRLLASTGTD